MSERRQLARANAWRRYPEELDPYNEGIVDDWGRSRDQRDAFCAGVEWADANPKPRTITRAEFEDAYTCWFDGFPSREDTFVFLRLLGTEVEDNDE